MTGTPLAADRCAECERSALAVHTAQIELEHRNMVIVSLQQRVAQLEAEAASAKGKK